MRGGPFPFSGLRPPLYSCGPMAEAPLGGQHWDWEGSGRRRVGFAWLAVWAQICGGVWDVFIPGLAASRPGTPDRSEVWLPPERVVRAVVCGAWFCASLRQLCRSVHRLPAARSGPRYTQGHRVHLVGSHCTLWKKYMLSCEPHFEYTWTREYFELYLLWKCWANFVVVRSFYE